jgi:hypothetical protein
MRYSPPNVEPPSPRGYDDPVEPGAEAVGEHVFERFIRNRRKDGGSCRAHATSLEVSSSFPLP